MKRENKESIKCVLLVDDDKATQFFNRFVIGRHDSFEQVVSVENGKDAITYLKATRNDPESKPELIFLDINMPKMNGWKFLNKFKKLDTRIRNGVRIILVSASADPYEVEEGMKKYKVDAYINKPLSFPVLNEILEKHYSTSC